MHSYIAIYYNYVNYSFVFIGNTLGSSTAPTAVLLTSDAENSVHLAKVNVLEVISSNLIYSSSYSSLFVATHQ